MIEAINCVFSNCKIRCCNFHWKQSLKRKIEQRHAAQFRTKDSNIGQYLRLVFSFSALDPDMVPEFFLFIQAQCPL